jgi:hypothetical protein
MCGFDAARKIRFVTTKWSDIDKDRGLRQQEAITNMYWKPLIELGSERHEFKDSYASARNIIHSIAMLMPNGDIQIQKELVQLQKTLPETAAAIALRKELEISLSELKARSREFHRKRTPETEVRYQEMLNHTKSVVHQIRELKIPFTQKLLNFFGLDNRVHR